MIRVLLVDDHALFRQTLSCSLRQSTKGFVVYEAANGKAAIDFLSGQVVDVVLLDIQMPVMNGIEAFGHIKRIYPNLKVIALTQLDDPSLIVHLLRTGINGFLLKGNVDLNELQDAITETIDKGEYCNELVSQVRDRYRSSPSEFSNLSLSPREAQLFQLIKAGLSNKDMAKLLGLELFTVESYRKSLMQKTGCRNTADVVSLAYRIGINNP